MWAGRVEVGAALRLVSVETLIGLLGLSLLNYGLRFVRWHYYIRSLGGRISIRHDLRIYIGGFALTTTPGKAGEMARSVWLRPYGVPAATSIAAFFAERIQDFLGIVLLASLAVARFHGGAWVLLGGVALVLAALITLYVPAISRTALRFLTTRHGKMQAVARRVTEILLLTRTCFTPGRFVVGLVIGICAWSAEGLGLYALMSALEHALPVVPAIGIFAFSTLAGALSFMPGGLGGTEVTMIVLLRLFAIPLPIAVSATLLIQVVTLWFAVLLGSIALSIRAKTPPLDSTVCGAPTRRDTG
jgi:glycosyltransferase 2 family protein